MSKTFRGISLLDLRAQVAEATGSSDRPELQSRAIGNRLPCAALPAFRDESALVGLAALHHRRGTGLSWPPEAQLAPNGGGPPRVPLASCWRRLYPGAAASGLDIGGLNQEFRWTPRPGESGRARPADLLAASALEFAEHDEDTDLVLVVPDRVEESGTQLLRDALDSAQLRRYQGHARRGTTRLLWRSAAVALFWCSRHRAEFAGRGSESEDGEPLGILPIVNFGLDSFSVVVCEIVARRHRGATWLVPIVDRRQPSALLGPWGISLLAAQALNRSESLDVAWTELLSGAPSSFTSFVFDKNSLSEVTNTGWTRQLRAALSSEPGLADLLPPGESLDPSPLGRRLLGEVRRRRSALEGRARTVLGAVLAGSCGPVQLRQGLALNTIARKFLADMSVPAKRVVEDSGTAAAAGAAAFAWCSAHGHPTYRERLQPLDFFAVGRDALGDPSPSWTALVDVETVEGGRVYRRPTPIDGMHISAGRDTLKLLLRSAREGRAPQVREVPAVLDRAVQGDEPVELQVSVDPGQGYARVDVVSSEPGLFRKSLDWKKMSEGEEPSLHLSYMTQVQRVDADWKSWRRTQPVAEAVLEALTRGAGEAELLRRLTELRADHLNRHSRDDTDPWRLLGPIGSDGSGVGPKSSELLRAITSGLGERTASVRDENLDREIIRTVGWMFSGSDSRLTQHILEPFVRVVEESGRRRRLPSERLDELCRAVSPAHLTAAGQVLTSTADIGTVFRAAALRFRLSMDGTNHWLRALRNLVRYRQHCLDPRGVPREVLDSIHASVTQRLEEQVLERNYKLIFSNCLTIHMYLLKRRRYEPEFPVQGTGQTQLADLLRRAIGDLRVQPRHRRIAEITLRFLERRGSTGDAEEFIQISE